ncbi:unnamed protein product [Auanema sp. JU1783]|nr:unnamed protein product [Auanema sp. JU1783]
MLSVPRVAVRTLAYTRVMRHGNYKSGFQSRSISSNEVFNTSTIPSTSSFEIPSAPLPPEAGRTIEEMIASGESVLSELGLISWWKPSSYFRMALEGIHTSVDMPWWATIVSATIALRLALIIVPVMSQRLVAKQSQYKTELNEFRERMEEARKEGNNMLQQQVFMEQRDFLRSKDIRLGRQFMILLANGGVFATQFFAIKKMIAVNYPGLSTGGTAWFTDLTMSDPYYALPFISAATMALVSRVGIEMGTSADQMTPAMKIGMQYALPVVIFAVSSQFASGLCVYWCASNTISLVYAGAFRNEAVRKLFKIPPVVKHDTPKKQDGAFKQIMANMKANKTIPPSIAQLREQDAQQFKKAGRGKPIVK